jgi:hypothetical protein
MSAERVLRATVAMALALAAQLAHPGSAGASTPPESAAERAFARTASTMNAHEITGNLARYTGTHVNFHCTVTAIVDSETMIGQCGRDNEPVDLYVMTRTAGLRIGRKVRVLGEMLVPSQWTDVTGHTWYTPMVKADFLDRF